MTTKLNLKNETIYHDGKIYEIGSIYQFSDNNIDWFAAALKGIDLDISHNFSTGHHYFKFCIELDKRNIGSITPAPVKLIDGDAYELDYIAGKFIGIYDKKENIFHLSHNRTIQFHLTENITHLVPSKA